MRRPQNRLAHLITNATNDSWNEELPCEEDEEIWDLRTVGPDGSVELVASYRVDVEGNVQWMTPDREPRTARELFGD